MQRILLRCADVNVIEEWRTVFARPERCLQPGGLLVLTIALCALARYWDSGYALESEIRGIFFRDNPYFVAMPSSSVWSKVRGAFFDKRAVASNRLSKLLKRGTSEEALEETIVRQLAKAQREPTARFAVRELAQDVRAQPRVRFEPDEEPDVDPEEREPDAEPDARGRHRAANASLGGGGGRKAVRAEKQEDVRLGKGRFFTFSGYILGFLGTTNWKARTQARGRATQLLGANVRRLSAELGSLGTSAARPPAQSLFTDLLSRSAPCHRRSNCSSAPCGAQGLFQRRAT
jgi:hypothetical protein